jgi:putative ABC transport system permease protein
VPNLSPLIPLDVTDLIFALGFIIVAMALSVWQRLGLEWQLALAAGRTILQLVVVGYVLGAVFAWRNPWAVLLILAVMLTVAALTARNRIQPKNPQLLAWIWGAIAFSTALTLTYTNWLILTPSVWSEPQYLIPLGSIILGNVMNGAALAGERLQRSIQTSRNEIETHLCLGASPRQAIRLYFQESIRAGLIPTLNTMMVVGIVQLPGIMTGQLLSGSVAPEEAVSYQILIMFMLAFATLVTTLLVCEGVYRQAFTGAAQLKG